MKFLVVRTDRIGDVVLSLPIAEILKERFPDAEVHFMISPSLKELLSNEPYIDKSISYNSQGFRKSVALLKKEGFDIAFLVFPTLTLSLALFLAHIPKRIGTGYRWYSLLLNRRIYEHRHTSEKHELVYNLGLLKAMGITTPVRKPHLHIKQEEKR